MGDVLARAAGPVARSASIPTRSCRDRSARCRRGTRTERSHPRLRSRHLYRRCGRRACKLRPLADELGVSTGSFYHHVAERPPVGRIRLLSPILRRRGLSRLAIAIRACAESNAHAARAVERHDELVLGFPSEYLIENGFTPHEAAVRGDALITPGLGKVHAPHLSIPALMDELIGILCVPPRA